MICGKHFISCDLIPPVNPTDHQSLGLGSVSSALSVGAASSVQCFLKRPSCANAQQFRKAAQDNKHGIREADMVNSGKVTVIKVMNLSQPKSQLVATHCKSHQEA